MKEALLVIEGMKCGMCETHINDIVRKIRGVRKVKSSHSKGNTIVIFENDEILPLIKEAISKQGYKVVSETVNIYQKKKLFSSNKKR